MKLGKDTNGNKVLKLESFDLNGAKGFSIQTLGNLPKVHTMDNKNLDIKEALKEATTYISKHGTDIQKAKMAL